MNTTRRVAQIVKAKYSNNIEGVTRMKIVTEYKCIALDAKVDGVNSAAHI